jgi:phenylacetate-CoA ligase
MVLTFDAQRTFIEILDPDAQGYGRLTISMLDPSRQVPLLRYQTGDVARFLDSRSRDSRPSRHGVAVGELPRALLALRGARARRCPMARRSVCTRTHSTRTPNWPVA